MAAVHEYISKIDSPPQDYYQSYNAATQMRQESISIPVEQ
jgi:hypothetical protein